MSRQDTIPARSTDIIQRLMRGYQFSPSDRTDAKLAPLYHTLKEHYAFFERHFAIAGMVLCNDDGVILLENDEKELSTEEKQSVVVLWLFVDLSLERGDTWSNLVTRAISWRDLPWFQAGYGELYLSQVNIADLDDIANVWSSMQRKGLVAYRSGSDTVSLRAPAERIINKALDIQKHYRQQSEDAHGTR